MQDSALAALAPALEGATIAPHLANMVGQPLTLQDIRVLRHKPGRRALIAYDVSLADGKTLTLLGKGRSRGADHRTYQLQQQLWHQSFDDGSADGLSVPQPLGILPDFHLWFQAWVPGKITTDCLGQSHSAGLWEQVAAAITKLHQAKIAPAKSHTLEDELRILHERLPAVATDYPHWRDRLTGLLERCTALAATLAPAAPTGIHRDFYPDQVLIADGPKSQRSDHDRLYLLDLDLYCEGDPALDIGNFVAHLTEHSLRTFGHPNGHSAQEAAFVEGACRLNPALDRESIAAYKTLTLVRHIAISHQMPSRQAITPHLIDLCEQRLCR
ncbi:aminoglycoside phosphotransferase [Leptolyngbya sp. BL0902]|nr:aminoglycoside phosphotransferase [Leptolyngbya sp. BL0902]